MQQKVIEVPEYAPRYGVYNKKERRFCLRTEELIEAIEYIESRFTKMTYEHPNVSFTMKVESYTYTEYYGSFLTRPRKYTIKTYEATPFVILADGVIVDRETVQKAIQIRWRENHSNSKWESRWALREALNERLVKVKGCGNKIKTVCAKYMGDRGYWRSIGGYYRSTKTQQERRVNDGHMNEYGTEMVRGKRRDRYLPNSWDDIQSSLGRAEMSWKHHSKRRKQWKAK